MTASYVGMETLETPLNGKTDITITLKENSETLNELVVVGYGTQRKSDVTGSVASISEKQMKQTIVTNADRCCKARWLECR